MQPTKAKILVIFKWATWCQDSTLLKESVKFLKQRFGGKSVLFIALNYSDINAEWESGLIAQELNIPVTMKKIKGTGKLIIFNNKNKMLREVLGADQGFEELAQAIEHYLGNGKSLGFF